MYKSPIELEVENIVSDVVKKADEYIVRYVQQVGVNVDKDELIKALAYDRWQYEKGWNDRDAEIVRCKDCKWHRTCEFYYALGNDRVPYETISECLKWHDDVPVDFYCAFGERREDDNH